MLFVVSVYSLFCHYWNCYQPWIWKMSELKPPNFLEFSIFICSDIDSIFWYIICDSISSFVLYLWGTVIQFFVRVRSVFGFYTENGPVTILNQKNFKELVLDSNEVWMVEFFAPYLVWVPVSLYSWCGHCKAMKDDWIKAANAMGGIVHFGISFP